MKLFKREKYLQKLRGFYFQNDLIKVLTGIRRCGKSSIMQMVADEIKSDGINEDQIVYINLDKKGYKSIKTAGELENLIDSLCPGDDNYYLFIDEIQNVKNFETIINAYREEGNFSIFITGSNSYLLSGELVTKLTGRYIEFEIYPLTFDEYLSMKSFYNLPVTNNLNIELNNFIMDGGFPRSVRFSSSKDKRTYTSGIVEEIFKKDISLSNKIKNRKVFELVQNFVINNFGSTISVKNIVKDVTNNGIATTANTVRKYIKILEDAKIIEECKRFDLKSRKSLKTHQKFYLTDLSLYFMRNVDDRINFGPVLENLVYIYARSNGYKVAVGRIGNLECDFIMRKDDFEYSYTQVAMTILADNATEDREYKSLEKIHDNYPKYILTRDTLLQKRNGILHENIEQFMANHKLF